MFSFTKTLRLGEKIQVTNYVFSTPFLLLCITGGCFPFDTNLCFQVNEENKFNNKIIRNTSVCAKCIIYLHLNIYPSIKIKFSIHLFSFIIRNKFRNKSFTTSQGLSTLLKEMFISNHIKRSLVLIFYEAFMIRLPSPRHFFSNYTL